MLHRHATRAHHLQAVYINSLVIGLGRGSAFVELRFRPNNPGTVALRGGLPLLIQFHGDQIPLATDQLLDTLGQWRPLLAGDVEMASQIEQSTLAHLALDTNRLHQAIGVIGLPGAPALDAGSADVHDRAP